MNQPAIFPPSRPHWQRAIDWPFAVAKNEPAVVAFGIAAAAGCALYRAALAWIISSGRAQAMSLSSEQFSSWAFLQAFGNDWLVVAGLTLAYLGLKFWLRLRMPQLMATLEMRVAEVITAGLGLLLFSLLLRVHQQLVLQLETGLTWGLVQVSAELLGAKDLLRLINVRDWLFVVSPLLVFALALRAKWYRKNFKPVMFTCIAGVLALQFLPGRFPNCPELSANPLIYFLDDVAKDTIGYFWRHGNGFRDSKLLPGERQLQSIALVDEAFISGAPPLPELPPHPALTTAGKPWNVLLFVMESTGADYAFDSSFTTETPMPFLRRLASESLYCTNHFSACNSSPGAAFSILTGLYPPPEQVPFSLRADASIPIWNAHLGNNYDCFLIHPSRSTYSFPVRLFQNNGITNLYFQEQLPVGPLPDRTEIARNEINTERFLEQRLQAAHEPFFGVYWSFVPHHPYTDYGPDFRIRPNIKTKHDRYYNNLRLLDTELQHLFRHLEQTGLADRTVVILVGDHGEAFGQHPGVWSHSFGSYAEMYRVPLLFWQPKLISPRTVTRPTTHVDILPTLLDLLAERWNPSRLQGESLPRDSNRKYIFAMDAQADYITSISTNLNKVFICRADDAAFVYNLAKDPHERIPLNDYNFPEQTAALLKFCNYQKQMIEDYNAAIQAGHRYPAETP